MNHPPSIYIIGVSAAGKTTLVTALAGHLRATKPDINFCVIDEVAREIVLQKGLDPRDIQNGEGHAMDLQITILETQAMREHELMKHMDLIVSDRSGIDPIAFTMCYGKPALVQVLLDSEAWKFLRTRMQSGLVVLCEPQPQWFAEDGVRILPASSQEIFDLHETFCELLRAQNITFETLTASQRVIEDRVQAVMHFWERMKTGLDTD